MRCLLFTDTINDVNGVARFLRTFAAWASEHGHELLIMSSSAKVQGHWAGEANIEVCPPLARMQLPGYADLDVTVPPMLHFLTRAREFGPDCVHVSTPGPVGIAGVWIAKKLGAPLAGTWHTNFPAYVEQITGVGALGEIAAEALALFYQKFDLVLARSPASLPEIRAAGAVRSQAFRPGVDLRRFSPAWRKREIWREWNLDPDRAKVLYVGRISIEKNLPMLVDAVAGIDEADVVIVGDGPYRTRMQSMLPNAAFLGFQHGETLSRLYASSDLVVFPSTTDTLGQVVLEAQASGVCVCVSDQGGPPHLVRQGETGTVLASRDASVWNACIRELLADRTHLRVLGTAAAERMLSFTIDESCGDFWAAHIELLNQLRARRA